MIKACYEVVCANCEESPRQSRFENDLFSTREEAIWNAFCSGFHCLEGGTLLCNTCYENIMEPDNF